MYKTKQKASYTINKEILREFNKKAKIFSINKSALIETLIQKWIEKNNEVE